MSKERDPFKFYLTIARQYAFTLPNEKDRITALKWLLKMKNANEQNARKIRNHALQLLIICLQRKRLIGPFEGHPQDDKELIEHDWSFQPIDIARIILQKEYEKLAQIPVAIEISGDTSEFVAYQEIPQFGAHFFYAYSPEPMKTWENMDKSLIPRGLWDISIISSPDTSILAQAVKETAEKRRQEQASEEMHEQVSRKEEEFTEASVLKSTGSLKELFLKEEPAARDIDTSLISAAISSGIVEASEVEAAPEFNDAAEANRPQKETVAVCKKGERNVKEKEKKSASKEKPVVEEQPPIQGGALHLVETQGKYIDRCFREGDLADAMEMHKERKEILGKKSEDEYEEAGHLSEIERKNAKRLRKRLIKEEGRAGVCQMSPEELNIDDEIDREIKVEVVLSGSEQEMEEFYIEAEVICEDPGEGGEVEDVSEDEDITALDNYCDPELLDDSLPLIDHIQGMDITERLNLANLLLQKQLHRYSKHSGRIGEWAQDVLSEIRRRCALGPQPDEADYLEKKLAEFESILSQCEVPLREQQVQEPVPVRECPSIDYNIPRTRRYLPMNLLQPPQLPGHIGYAPSSSVCTQPVGGLPSPRSLSPPDVIRMGIYEPFDRTPDDIRPELKKEDDGYSGEYNLKEVIHRSLTPNQIPQEHFEDSECPVTIRVEDDAAEQRSPLIYTFPFAVPSPEMLVPVGGLPSPRSLSPQMLSLPTTSSTETSLFAQRTLYRISEESIPSSLPPQIPMKPISSKTAPQRMSPQIFQPFCPLPPILQENETRKSSKCLPKEGLDELIHSLSKPREIRKETHLRPPPTLLKSPPLSIRKQFICPQEEGENEVRRPTKRISQVRPSTALPSPPTERIPRWLSKAKTKSSSSCLPSPSPQQVKMETSELPVINCWDARAIQTQASSIEISNTQAPKISGWLAKSQAKPTTLPVPRWLTKTQVKQTSPSQQSALETSRKSPINRWKTRAAEVNLPLPQEVLDESDCAALSPELVPVITENLLSLSAPSQTPLKLSSPERPPARLPTWLAKAKPASLWSPSPPSPRAQLKTSVAPQINRWKTRAAEANLPLPYEIPDESECAVLSPGLVPIITEKSASPSALLQTPLQLSSSERPPARLPTWLTKAKPASLWSPSPPSPRTHLKTSVAPQINRWKTRAAEANLSLPYEIPDESECAALSPELVPVITENLLSPSAPSQTPLKLSSPERPPARLPTWLAKAKPTSLWSPSPPSPRTQLKTSVAPQINRWKTRAAEANLPLPHEISDESECAALSPELVPVITEKSTSPSAPLHTPLQLNSPERPPARLPTWLAKAKPASLWSPSPPSPRTQIKTNVAPQINRWKTRAAEAYLPVPHEFPNESECATLSPELVPLITQELPSLSAPLHMPLPHEVLVSSPLRTSPRNLSRSPPRILSPVSPKEETEYPETFSQSHIEEEQITCPAEEEVRRPRKRISEARLRLLVDRLSKPREIKTKIVHARSDAPPETIPPSAVCLEEEEEEEVPRPQKRLTKAGLHNLVERLSKPRVIRARSLHKSHALPETLLPPSLNNIQCPIEGQDVYQLEEKGEVEKCEEEGAKVARPKKMISEAKLRELFDRLSKPKEIKTKDVCPTIVSPPNQFSRSIIKNAPVPIPKSREIKRKSVHQSLLAAKPLSTKLQESIARLTQPRKSKQLSSTTGVKSMPICKNQKSVPEFGSIPSSSRTVCPIPSTSNSAEGLDENLLPSSQSIQGFASLVDEDFVQPSAEPQICSPIRKSSPTKSPTPSQLQQPAISALASRIGELNRIQENIPQVLKEPAAEASILQVSQISSPLKQGLATLSPRRSLSPGSPPSSLMHSNSNTLAARLEALNKVQQAMAQSSRKPISMPTAAPQPQVRPSTSKRKSIPTQSLIQIKSDSMKEPVVAHSSKQSPCASSPPASPGSPSINFPFANELETTQIFVASSQSGSTSLPQEQSIATSTFQICPPLIPSPSMRSPISPTKLINLPSPSSPPSAPNPLYQSINSILAARLEALNRMKETQTKMPAASGTAGASIQQKARAASPTIPRKTSVPLHSTRTSICPTSSSLQANQSHSRKKSTSASKPISARNVNTTKQRPVTQKQQRYSTKQQNIPQPTGTLSEIGSIASPVSQICQSSTIPPTGSISTSQSLATRLEGLNRIQHEFAPAPEIPSDMFSAQSHTSQTCSPLDGSPTQSLICPQLDQSIGSVFADRLAMLNRIRQESAEVPTGMHIAASPKSHICTSGQNAFIQSPRSPPSL